MSRIDLRRADLRSMDLRGADLRGVDLAGRDLSRARRQRADLRHAALAGCDLRDADLRGADLRRADLRGAALARARLVEADARRADLTGANLVRAHLSAARLDGAALPAANLDGARLERAALRGADLRAATLRGAAMGRVDLRFADLRGARAVDARLVGASLRDARIEGADLRRVDARFGDWRGARLSGARLVDADLTWCDLSGVTAAGLDLTRAELDGAALTGDLEGAVLDGARLGGGWIGGRLDRARLAGVDLRWAGLRPLSLDGASLVDARVDPLAVDALRAAAAGARRCTLLVGLAGGARVTVDLLAGRFVVEADGTWPEPRAGLVIPVALSARVRVGPRAALDPDRRGRGVGDRAFDEAVAVIGDRDHGALARLTPPVRAAVARWVAHGGQLDLGLLRCPEPAAPGARLLDAAVIALAAAQPVPDPDATILNRLPREPDPAVRHRLLARWLTAGHRPRPIPPSVDPAVVEGALHDLIITRVEPRWAFEQLAFAPRRRRLPSLDGVDLTGARLGGARLAGRDLRGVVLVGADLEAADLSGADLRGADLGNGVLTAARLTEADLRGARLARADLARARLDGADLGGAHAAGADFAEAELRGARLRGANVESARFSGARLDGADLTDAHLVGARFVGCAIDGATLSGADLTRASFARARLRRVRFTGARVHRARFSAAALTDVDLSAAHVDGARFDDARAAGVDLRGADLSGDMSRAVLRGADLRGATITGALDDADLAGADLRGAEVAPRTAARVILGGARVELDAVLALADVNALTTGVGEVGGPWSLREGAPPGRFEVRSVDPLHIAVTGGGVGEAEVTPGRVLVRGSWPDIVATRESGLPVLGRPLGRVFSGPELDLGDAPFDAAVFLHTVTRLTVFVRLDPSTRRRIRAFVERGGVIAGGRIERSDPGPRLGRSLTEALAIARALTRPVTDVDAELLARARREPRVPPRAAAIGHWLAHREPTRTPPGDLDAAAVEQALLALLDTGTPAQRVRAAELLGERGSKAAIDPLAALAGGWFTASALSAAARAAVEALIARTEARYVGGLTVAEGRARGALSRPDDNER